MDEVNVIAYNWVDYYLSGDESNFSATEDLLELVMLDPKRAWTIIKLISNIPIADNYWKDFVDANVAAGPIEELLSQHGPEFVDCLPQKIHTAINLDLTGI